MVFSAEIVDVLQTLNLETGRSVNSLRLRLADGTTILTAIEDEDLQKILAKVGTVMPLAEELVAPRVPTTALQFDAAPVSPSIEQGQAAVFGGDVASIPPQETPVPEPTPATAAAVPVRRKQKPPMDEHGYPIMPSNGGRDPGEIVANGQNKDEDGVPSL